MFRFREFRCNMSQRRAGMLNMLFLDLVLLKGFFIQTDYYLSYVAFLYPRYTAFSVVVKNCKPLMKLFIRSLRICLKSVNKYFCIISYSVA